MFIDEQRGVPMGYKHALERLDLSLVVALAANKQHDQQDENQQEEEPANSSTDGSLRDG